MSAPLAILIVCLLVVAAAMRFSGTLLLILFVFLMLLFVISMLARFARFVASGGFSERESERKPGDDLGPDTLADRLMCPDPHCRRVNEARARFCGQCGKPLR